MGNKNSTENEEGTEGQTKAEAKAEKKEKRRSRSKSKGLITCGVYVTLLMVGERKEIFLLSPFRPFSFLATVIFIIFGDF